MSIAGIRSNRGDGYQTLVAFDWGLTVLSDSGFQWIEVDSVSYSVDDTVVGKTNGSLICCQCKKNQVDFKSWTITDFADELKKAAGLLVSKNNVEVRFYSRSPFSTLAKLREDAANHADEKSYCAKLSKENKKTNTSLAKILATKAPKLSTYEFLCKTTFEISPELDRMETLLYERLRSMVSNPKAAANALWVALDKLGGRINGHNPSASSQHRLTKEDLKSILQDAGAMLAPSMDLVEVRFSFTSTSAIGRSWQRNIAGQRIASPIVNELLAAIDAKKRAILLTGLPGSGKTCVILDVQEALEQRAKTQAGLVPLFIQAREFSDLAMMEERQALGLSGQWVEQAARMAEEAQVVVVIDSLDVLSIAREHAALTYFLAQIDRLLLIPNITVVTACRDFDRRYDRRIAERQWDCELKCAPLNWESEIIPLLDSLDIGTKNIDKMTRELICNPRELALFVELAQREGSFSVVTSQALAQRYLETIVRADKALGDVAMKAIEAVADDMLKSRSLTIPHQRFSASQDIQRALCSLNVLQETQDGKLTFGHQTLLDVLVINGAVRQGVTLNEFIQGLPPVPFVRPSIRSFVAQLATGERKEFRKQLRTVLTGNAAFHIRRLVAESFSEQVPQDDDWPLIRDLRNRHREVFQVIYIQATQVAWHHFWVRHLMPVLMDTRDTEGLTTHVHHTSQWTNDDPAGVLQFWMKALSLDWFDNKEIAGRLGLHLSKIDTGNLALVAPLLERLLSMPRRNYDFLEDTIARCVTAEVIEDIWLWRYVAGDINDDDVIKYQFNKKLRCQSHEFGSTSENNFFYERMKQSTALLDLAVESIEQWSRTKSSRYAGVCKIYRSEFLKETSYKYAHSQHETRHVDSENILLDAIEAAILGHAQAHSKWWENNRARLCFNHEGALRYFAILACTNFPQENIDWVGRMLSDKKLLESDLSYELGTLMQAAFIYLDRTSQDAVMACILSVRDENIEDEHRRLWVLKKRVELIVTIPCYLRSSEAQAMLDTYEAKEGVLIRQPDIQTGIRRVSVPFSFEVFLGYSNNGVLRLLAHYLGYTKDFDGFPFSREPEVGVQLREAASRQPIRFLRLLFTRWAEIPGKFRDDIMDGTATYLNYRHGNLKINGEWTPIEEPNAFVLAGHMLDELERHSDYWHHNRVASNALQACAYVIQDMQNAARLVFMAIGFASLREDSFIEGNPSKLLTTGINMTGGRIAETLMILVNKLQENSVPFPELLAPTLRRFAGHEHPAIRALILRRLPYLQSQNPALGWDLFERAMQNANGLWQDAESCLHYAYRNDFKKIAPMLDRIHREGSEEDRETWGRISALSAFSNRIDLDVLLEDLKFLDATKAWQGAASVWTHLENIKQHRDQCLVGIKAGLNANSPHAEMMAQKMEKLFYTNTPVISIPIELVRLLFTVLERDSKNKHHHDLFRFGQWLNATAHHDPEQAIAATETYLIYVKHTKPYLYDRENNLTQLMTRLFAEAEEREESDNGGMLQRVVSLQDTLLSLGLNGINDWLKAAERP